MPYAFPRIVLVLLAAALPGLPACEQRPLTVVARAPSDTETGALSLRARSSSRQAHGTYDPVTGRFLRARTTTRDYAVQLLAGRYLTVADVGTAGSVPWQEAGLRDEVHALGDASGAAPRSYASDARCLANEWFGARPRLAYRWEDSCLLIWTAPAWPWSEGVPRPAVQLTFD